jgi:hypothetical protein
MSARSISHLVLRRWASSGLAVCLLLVAAAAPASAYAERTRDNTCQSGRGKAKGRAGRAGRKSKAAQQEAPPPARESSESSDADPGEDLLGGLDDDSPKQEERPAPKPQPASKPEPRAPERVREEPAEEPAVEPESPSEDAEPSTEPATEAPPSESEEGAQAADDGPSVSIEPFAGFGIATRSVRMPWMTGALEIAPGVTPAFEVGLRVQARPRADFSFFVNLVYQSALGFSVTERPPLALPKEVGARSERVALEFAPRWRFSNGQIELGIPVGATVRTLWAEVHMSQTPSFSLVGPHARAELQLRFSDAISLRVAPELQYIMMVDDDVKNAGVSSSGVALGGDASVEAQISRAWSLRINYRESHALLSATRGSVSFSDVERYLTLRAVGSF